MNIEQYDELTSYNRDIYLRKNSDYGNSFDESYREWGMIAGIVRIDDKMRRIKSLYKGGAKIGETMQDTLLDMANYCIMLAGCLDEKTKPVEECDILEPEDYE